MKRIEIEDRRFGLLLVLAYLGRQRYVVECECGTIKSVHSYKLRSRNTRSCGCLRDKMCGVNFTKHGGRYTKEYSIWQAMKNRCYSPNSPDYLRYGGRGIRVCDRWLDPEHGFENFFADMGPRPVSNGKRSYYSIERKDNDGDYCPENCYWATVTEQANNRRNNRVEEYNGRRQTVAQWIAELGVNISTFHNHLRCGKAFKDVMTFFKEKNNAHSNNE